MSAHKDGKTKVSISIAPDIVKRAHSLGINVSKACENTLIELIKAIENRNAVNKPLLAPASSGRSGKELGMERAGDGN
ncbi:MAG: type II toxin-antitoxin system CcdA family antitoxin [Candidatus Bathyarchaeia archaeon]